jgi:hypothetical protein
MKYLGIARAKNGRIAMPDSFSAEKEVEYEVVEIGNDILLIPAPVDHQRLESIRQLAEESIKEHRDVLEKLAR